MIKSKEFERVLTDLVASNNDEWALERLEKALHEATRAASDKRFRMRQGAFKVAMGGK